MAAPADQPSDEDAIGMEARLDADVAAVARISAVPTILEVVCRTTGMGFAAVARVTDRRWIACSVHDEIDFGLKPGGELDLQTTICHEIRQSGEPVVINNVGQDDAYRTHHTPLLYGFQSYISLPITRRDGSFFGTLCAIDPRPARLDKPETIAMLKLFADLIAFHLDADDRLAASEAKLLTERVSAKLREQFIAVLGHDLRNPLMSVSAGTEMLLKDPPRDRAVAILKLMQMSVGRMGGLIENVLDFARGRLGGGLALDRRPTDLEPLLRDVIEELKVAYPHGDVVMEFQLAHPVTVDPTRLSQLASNLIGNALTHGAPDEPIRVRAISGDGGLELSVSNGGDVIPPEAIKRLFQPFERGAINPSKEGLGLGLYIASEIAKAHGGTLTASSSPERTSFTFRMPAAR